MRRIAWFLFVTSLAIPAAAQDAPSQADQDRMIEAMRNYAADYTDKLPNFICQEIVSQFEAGRKPTKWRQGDTLTSKLVYNNGREERTLVTVNDKTVTAYKRGWRKPLTTSGEFGMVLSSIFNPETQTKFSWEGWDDIRGHRAAKFSYSIDQPHSMVKLTDLTEARVPCHGSVWADPQTGDVWRVTVEAEEIPKEIHIRSIATTIDYDTIPIGGKSYLLPVKVGVLMATGTNHVRNEKQFEGYRKFETESTITFGDAPQTKQ